MSWISSSLAGFQVILYGRFWVITEEITQTCTPRAAKRRDSLYKLDGPLTHDLGPRSLTT
jgi:hypothetical protein